MLIRFTFENYLSFYSNTIFSTIASRKRTNINRLPKMAKYKMKLTPITAIFGANASGKSNFCQAIKFARDFVLWNDMSNLNIFLLDNESKTKPSVFTFEILVDETVYEFSFSILDNKIQEEKLIKITSYTEVTLYERHNHVVCYNDLVKSPPRDTIALGYLDIPEVQNVYNWFKDMIFIDDQIDCSIQQVNEILHTIDSRIGKIPFSMKKESMGIKRLIKLLPFFVILLSEQSKKVVIIDDLDQHLHSNLTKSLLELYLSTCSVDTRKQLIFTTHDTTLLEHSLLRTDEIWRIDRDFYGISSMLPFSAYKGSNKDKNIRKSYLEGRLGGI